MTAPSADAKHRRHDVGDTVGVAYRRKLNQPCAFPITGQQVGGDLQRQAGLTNPAHPVIVTTRDSPNAAVTQRHLGLSPDERADLSRKIPRKRVQCP